MQVLSRDNESRGHCYCSSIKVESCYVAVSLFGVRFIEYFIVYENVPTTHFVFHSQLRAIRRISFNALLVIPNPYLFVAGVDVVDTRHLLEYYASRWKTK